MFVERGDLRLYVESVGSGEPLIALHGFTGSAADWRPLRPRLDAGLRVITIDLIGHGRSDAPAEVERYGLMRCVDDLVGVMDVLGIERAHWLGYSMGGRVALALALSHPQRISRLILESASPGLAEASARRERRAADAALARSIDADGIEAFVDRWMAQPLFASQARLSAPARAAARAARIKQRPLGLANSLRGMGTGSQPSFWEQLPQLEPETLLISGGLDTKFCAIAAAIAARAARARVAVIADAGHAAHLEEPERFAGHVNAFLARASGLGRGNGIGGKGDKRDRMDVGDIGTRGG